MRTTPNIVLSALPLAAACAFLSPLAGCQSDPPRPPVASAGGAGVNPGAVQAQQQGAAQARKQLELRQKTMDSNPTVTAADKAKYRASLEGVSRPEAPAAASGKNPFYHADAGGKR